MSGAALRVLALAYKRLPMGVLPDQEGAETGLILLGLVGMLRPAPGGGAGRAGTGPPGGHPDPHGDWDHPRTAEAVARELGILQPGEEAVLGRMLDGLDEAELRRLVRERSVFARVALRHKVQLVKALQKCGARVAMTGDGVNDAAAIKEADVGIAMGRCGVEVTREAASVVLTDDRFDTILAAVEEGGGSSRTSALSCATSWGAMRGRCWSCWAPPFWGCPCPSPPSRSSG